MYDLDINLSQKRKNANIAFVEAAIDTYEANNKNNKEKKEKYTTAYQEDAMLVISNTMQRERNLSRYRSFVETVKTSLVTEAVLHLFEQSVNKKILKDNANRTIMRSMVGQYVTENGYDNILNRMRIASTTLSEMHNIIVDSASAIIESVDKDNPSTFIITPEMKDNFYQSLDYADTQSIGDAIKDRVNDAMADFINANAKDHDEIEEALQQAQEKIDKVTEEDTELKESYEFQAKRKIARIRNSNKSVLHGMVSSMCESTLKHQDSMGEFLTEEGRLNIDKIVSRTSLMYTFMEMLNTSRLETIDEEFITNVISDLKK